MTRGRETASKSGKPQVASRFYGRYLHCKQCYLAPKGEQAQVLPKAEDTFRPLVTARRLETVESQQQRRLGEREQRGLPISPLFLRGFLLFEKQFECAQSFCLLRLTHKGGRFSPGKYSKAQPSRMLEM